MSTSPNDLRELRGPAASGVRHASELNGWSPSAQRNGYARGSFVAAVLAHQCRRLLVAILRRIVQRRITVVVLGINLGFVL